MTREWENAVHRGSIDELERLLTGGADIDALDGHSQTALMLAAVKGQEHVVAWLIERGAVLDHTAKYGLSALMLAAVNAGAEVIADGIKVELEHTDDIDLAKKIVLDHLVESPEYYDALEEMEKKL